MTTGDPIFPDIVAPSVRRCAVCGEPARMVRASHRPVQPAEAWYCTPHREEGEWRCEARYRGSSLGPALLL